MNLNLKHFARASFSLLLCLQFSLEPLVARASTTPAPVRQAVPSPKISHEEAYRDIDPVWQQFVEAQPTQDFKFTFSAQDPALDQDPYFMRSQSWIPRVGPETSMAFRKTAAGLEISVPGATRILNLRAPLTPIQATEDFIFLSLDQNSDLFARAAGANLAPGEGIFFISRTDLAQQSQTGKPAPVFFFPLAGQGWRGPLSSVELPQIESIAIANKTDSVAIELRDVETMMKGQQINLVMASSLSARNRNQITNEMYPAPGMTAAFGLFFTGIDLQFPAKSLWSPNFQTSQSLFERALLIPLVQKISRWLPLAEQSSEALTLPPALIKRLMFVGTALVGMLAVSVVIKYAHPGVRRKLKSLRADEKPVKNPMQLAGREIRETFDVFAAVSTTVSQVATVTFANSLELFLDRFAPSIASADHTLIRRFLNNTFYFPRNSIKSVAVNSRTFVLGALIMGGVDTAMVAVQYEVAVPLIAGIASHHLGPDMQDRIEKTFDPNNPNTKQIALQDTIRNGVSYLQSGASSYAAESRAQVIDPATQDVVRDMRARGLDPDDPKNRTQKEQEIQKKINVLLKQRGLPDSDQFLFDASKLFFSIPKALGYRSAEGLQAQESYVLETRFGLTANALRKAIETANQWSKNDSSPVARDAAALLSETADAMSFLKNGVTNGKAGLKRARDVRQQLTLLSYEGSVEYAVRNLPETWSQKYSPEAAQAAGLFFRQALYSYLAKEGDNLVISNRDDMDAYGASAKETAMAEVYEAHPEMKGQALTQAQEFELKVRTQIEINRLVRKAKVSQKADNYKPKKLDWVARRKQARALAETEARMDAYLRSLGAQEDSAEHLAETKQRFFAEALARQIGVHIEDPAIAAAQGREDYVKTLAWVEGKAQEGVELEIRNDPNLNRYLEKLSAPEQAKFKMFLYANNYLRSYKEATGSMEMVKATDPAQPGRFQRLRQTEIVRNSAFLTRTLRTFESFGEDQSMSLGLGGVLVRSLPLAQDLLNAHRRQLKTILPALMVSYTWNFYAWQVHMPFSAWLLMQLAGAATISTPSQWLNRVFRLNGIKAEGGVLTKIGFAFPYAWVTFLGMFPIMLYSPDVAVLFSDYVQAPILSVLGQIDLKEWIAVAAAVAGATGAAKLKLKIDFKTRAEGLKNLVGSGRKLTPVTCDQFL